MRASSLVLVWYRREQGFANDIKHARHLLPSRVCIQKARIDDTLTSTEAQQYEIILPSHCPTHKQPTKRNKVVKMHQRVDINGLIMPNPKYFDDRGPDKPMEHVQELTVNTFNTTMNTLVRLHKEN